MRNAIKDIWHGLFALVLGAGVCGMIYLLCIFGNWLAGAHVRIGIVLVILIVAFFIGRIARVIDEVTEEGIDIIGYR